MLGRKREPFEIKGWGLMLFSLGVMKVCSCHECGFKDYSHLFEWFIHVKIK